ncbi:hypothetical protein AKJ16_DCAP12949 [Drosera capensis]
MNESGGGGGVVDGGSEWWAPWWWAVASTGQLAWAIAAYRKGHAGDSRMMPMKAFGVASLFVGAGAAATIGTLKSFGIHQVIFKSFTIAVELVLPKVQIDERMIHYYGS